VIDTPWLVTLKVEGRVVAEWVQVLHGECLQWITPAATCDSTLPASHASLVSHPVEIAKLITDAASATARG